MTTATSTPAQSDRCRGAENFGAPLVNCSDHSRSCRRRGSYSWRSEPTANRLDKLIFRLGETSRQRSQAGCRCWLKARLEGNPRMALQSGQEAEAMAFSTCTLATVSNSSVVTARVFWPEISA